MDIKTTGVCTAGVCLIALFCETACRQIAGPSELRPVFAQACEVDDPEGACQSVCPDPPDPPYDYDYCYTRGFSNAELSLFSDALGLVRNYEAWIWLATRDQYHRGTFDMWTGDMADVHWTLGQENDGRLHIWVGSFGQGAQGLLTIICHEWAHVKTNKPPETQDFQNAMNDCINGTG